jgi:hypothetical protein
MGLIVARYVLESLLWLVFHQMFASPTIIPITLHTLYRQLEKTHYIAFQLHNQSVSDACFGSDRYDHVEDPISLLLLSSFLYRFIWLSAKNVLENLKK